MFLTDEELKRGIIENANAENFGNISYDLFIKEILVEGEHKAEYDLKPAESVFVSTIEILNVPLNMFAQVVPRNSAIRLGLDINAPIYQPGHKTRIFFRVTNVSSVAITIKKDTSVCSLMVYRLDGETTKPYIGVYSEEFDYRGVGDFHAIDVPEVGKLEKKLQALEKLEHRLYGNVMMMLTVFVAIFSLVNLNTSTLRTGYTPNEILTFNFTFLSIISALVLLIAEVLGSLKDRRFLFLVPIISLLIALVLQRFF